MCNEGIDFMIFLIFKTILESSIPQPACRQAGNSIPQYLNTSTCLPAGRYLNTFELFHLLFFPGTLDIFLFTFTSRSVTELLGRPMISPRQLGAPHRQ